MNKNFIIAIVFVLLALGGGFFAGMQYQKAKAPSFAGANGQFRGRFGQGANGGLVRGQVLSADSTGLTVKTMNGSSKIVIVSPSTMFMKSNTAIASDIKSGDTVMVVGTANSDGSVTAQNVSINPPTGRGQIPSATPTGVAQ